MLSFIPFYLAGVSGIAIVVGFRVLNGSSRYGLVILAVPLAIVPGLVGWWVAVTRLVNGFVELEAESLPSDVEAIVLTANRAAQSGHVASLGVLFLVLVLAVVLLATRPLDGPPVASALWSSGLIGATLACAAGYTVLVSAATPIIVIPLAISMPPDLVSADALGDPNSPLNQAGLATISRAATELDLSDSEAITSWVSLRITAAAVGNVALLFVCAVAFAAGILLLRLWSPTFSRRFLSLSFLMILALIGITGRQIQRHERIKYEAFRAVEMVMLRGLEPRLSGPPPPPLPPPLRSTFR